MVLMYPSTYTGTQVYLMCLTKKSTLCQAENTRSEPLLNTYCNNNDNGITTRHNYTAYDNEQWQQWLQVWYLEGLEEAVAGEGMEAPVLCPKDMLRAEVAELGIKEM